MGGQGLRKRLRGEGVAQGPHTHRMEEGKTLSEQIEELLREAIPELSTLSVTDVSGGCGAKFELIIVSQSFEGVPLLKRQRLVNDTLKPVMDQIHAVSMKTWTVAQW